ncbi:MAG: hypothetical protein A3F83_15260 [Candidatus Glassbacteria bacterium RIFCSPLOWO2_12_FULL_58_11]|uniref:Uncharacterized protein n=1 Tax=Candidatus Glassbacteria bacterium RIFCSPLOWO2_12_FULL_58_11 TaxID=1817867 RepID=A0A1F5YQ42_9BACT|nr:MAG: hypothetical protein A3F83_15260 [Candidatus Glassbacteria bacterium RIFCSPLOWO2_12_FULL_58_11]
MIIKSLKYYEYKDKPEYWTIEEFSLNQINLLVGKNASGKTRTLNLISGLAKIITGDMKMRIISGYNEICFDKKGVLIKYILDISSFKTKKEILIIDDKILLDRKRSGKGSIYAKQLGRNITFQAPEDVVAYITRRDNIQYPYLEDLFDWANSVNHFLFGTQLGKDIAPIFSKKMEIPDKDIRDTNKVVEIFLKGIKLFNNPFKESIIDDMRNIGYKIEDIGIEKLRNVQMPHNLPGYPVGLYVKECDLKCKTYQTHISQGMFRALSLIIQLNYSQLAGTNSCILIDDIGEGLDYERSTALIKLIIDKANKSAIQIIMSTNDRFIMNAVPLEYWQVILRRGGRCKIINYKNSRDLFDEFKFTGLANFDFFSTEYYTSNNK